MLLGNLFIYRHGRHSSCLSVSAGPCNQRSAQDEAGIMVADDAKVNEGCVWAALLEMLSSVVLTGEKHLGDLSQGEQPSLFATLVSYSTKYLSYPE